MQQHSRQLCGLVHGIGAFFTLLLPLLLLLLLLLLLSFNFTCSLPLLPLLLLLLLLHFFPLLFLLHSLLLLLAGAWEGEGGEFVKERASADDAVHEVLVAFKLILHQVVERLHTYTHKAQRFWQKPVPNTANLPQRRICTHFVCLTSRRKKTRRWFGSLAKMYFREENTWNRCTSLFADCSDKRFTNGDTAVESTN